ncbi:hypothetical protein NLJ89_g8523 [Agrocybe chaxingu]|uniref:Fungal-type protein kinase domain-containing protein n=1 Tax=Agrocybe chaxingu TaxID=84603 RepID=A0A9W8JXC0_9AGAR|nr:hypothetical protein NLJ89_g8523 [Agrocybe chaxingu]
MPVTICACTNEAERVQTLKDVLSETDGPGYTFLTNDRYLEQEFQGKTPSHDDILTFLKTTRLYCTQTQKWSRVRSDVRKTSHILHPIMKIVEEAIQYFGYSKRHVARVQPLTATANLWTSDGPETFRLSPDFVVTGSDNNFPPIVLVPGRSTVLKYDASTLASVASLFSVRTENEVRDQKKLIVELAALARDVFYHQGNRIHVYAAVVTERSWHLFRFDRGGLLKSPGLDIHSKAVDLVRCILILCSPNIAVIGLDPKVFWRDGTRYIRMHNAEEQEVDYRLTNPDPIYRLHYVQSRGSTIWAAKDENEQDIIVKDGWHRRSGDTIPEYELLWKTKGLDGVVQILSSEDSESDIKTMRGFFLRQHEFKANYLRSRIMLKAYGRPISFFTSRTQLLQAFRDAVAGHQRLWDNNIVHMDVSSQNILLGNEDAPVGQRGIIIDMDFAHAVAHDELLELGSALNGTMCFVSHRIMSNTHMNSIGRSNKSVCHTHLDDLESFAYVLCKICFSMVGPGRSKENIPEIVKKWLGNISDAANSKKSFWKDRDGYIEGHVSPYFGLTFQLLLKGLFHIIEDGITRLDETLEEHGYKKDYIFKAWADTSAGIDYTEYLQEIDEAIKQLRQEENGWQLPPLVWATEEPVSDRQDEALAPINPNTSAPLKRKRTSEVEQPDDDLENNEDTLKKKKKSRISNEGS